MVFLFLYLMQSKIYKPKYRRLNREELQELEKEFINFLVVQGITADDWESLKKEDQLVAESKINEFSDLVLHNVLQKLSFLEYRSKSEVKCFQCLKNQLVEVGLTAGPNKDTDFTDPAFLEKASIEPPKGIKVYTRSKEYRKERERELFDLISAGCEISDGKLFKTLCLALPE